MMRNTSKRGKAVKKTPITTWLPDEVTDRLRQTAADEQISLSAVIRRAIAREVGLMPKKTAA